MSIKSLLRKALIFIVPTLVLTSTMVAGAAILQGFQGGTGYGTGNLGNAAVGLNLQVASTSPFLTYTFAAGGSGSFTTTTINGLSTTAYTFATSGQTGLSFSTTAPGTITLTQATATPFVSGYLSAVDFTTFNNKQDTISVVPNLTFVGNLLNTIQDIQTTSSPTFASGTFANSLVVGTSGSGNIISSGKVSANNFDSTGSSIPANGFAQSAANVLTFYTASTPALSIGSSQRVSLNSLGTGLVKSTAGVLGNATSGIDYVSAITAGNGIGVSSSSGNVTITNIGVTSYNGATGSVTGVSAITAGTNITISSSSGNVTINSTASGASSATTTIFAQGATSTGPTFILATTTSYGGGFNILSDGSQKITFNFPGRINDLNGLATTSGNVFLANGSTWTSVPTSSLGLGGGSGTPGGASTQVQYNEAGAFAATSNFTFTTTTQQLFLNNASSSARIGANAQAQNFGNTTVSTVFSKIGASTSWTAPAGVMSVTITAIGAGAATSTSGGGTLGSASVGGVATGTFSVTPGVTYFINVGGKGIQGSGGNPIAGGYNGGGGGGGSVDVNRSGVGGGGCTFFGTNASFTQGSLIIVGAGGGGPGSDYNSQAGAGGNAGGLTGTNGTDGANNTGSGGTGGTQSAGGTSGGDFPGTSGAFALGGTATTSVTENGAGGGGGCGYFGGGGGGGGNGNFHAGGGGGGGSSFVTSTGASATSTAAATLTAQDGSLFLSYTVTGAKSYALAVDDDIVTGGGSPTLNACVGGSIAQGSNDTNGKINLGPSTTSCKLQFVHVSNNPVWCQATEVGVTSSTAYISAESTSSVTFGFTAATGGSMNYLCLRN